MVLLAATLQFVGCGSWGKFWDTTTSPINISNFTATQGVNQLSLSWTNPVTAFAGVKILRKTGSAPLTTADGIVAYNGTGTSLIDIGLTNGTQYYYTAFTYDTAGNFSSV